MCKQHHFIWRSGFPLVYLFTPGLSGIIDQGHHCRTPAAAVSYWKKRRFMNILVILNQGYRSYTIGSLVALNCRHYAKRKCRVGCQGSLPEAIGHLLYNLWRINLTVIKEYHPVVSGTELYISRRDTRDLQENICHLTVTSALTTIQIPVE